MQDIKAGQIDEDGMGINNVEAALERVDVKLRDSQHEFRNMSDVLEDVASKWNTLSETEQANISKAIAGVRQANIFSVLMNNMNQALELQEEQSLATGLAMDRYTIYLESAEAAQNKMTASWEKFAMTGLKGGMVSGFYNLISAILEFMSAIGGIPAILTTVIASFIAFNASAIALNITAALTAAGIFTVADAWAALTLAMATNPIGVIVLALSAAVLAFNYFNESVDETKEKLSKLNSEVDTLASNLNKLNKQKTSVEKLWKEFEKLKNTTNKSADEQERFFETQEELRNLLPEVSGYYDKQGRFILNAGVNLAALLKLKQIEIDKEKEKLALANKESSDASIDAYKDVRKKMSPEYRYNDLTEEENAKELKDLATLQKEYFNEIAETYFSFDEIQQKIMMDALENGDKIDKEIAEQLKVFKDSVDEKTDLLKPLDDEIGDSFGAVSDESQKAFDKLLDNVVKMLKDIKEQEKDNLQQQLKDYKRIIDQRKQEYQDQLKRQKEIYDDERETLQRQKEDEQRIYDDREEAIKNELDGYKKIIDAQQELLKLRKEEDDFNNEREKKQNELAKLEEQILVLSLDNSAEAIAERLGLEEDAQKIRDDMANDDADRSFTLQNQALEQEKQLAEETSQIRIQELEAEKEADSQRYEMRLREIEDEQENAERRYEIRVRELDNSYDAKEQSLEKQIQLIDNYLSREGDINRQAMEMILDNNSNVYNNLMEWNHSYGTGINDDIIKMWELAGAAVESYRDTLNGVSNSMVSPSIPSDSLNPFPNFRPSSSMPYPQRHSGLDSGFVGDKAKLKSNEEFAKLLKGEIVINPTQMDNFMKNILPQSMIQSSGMMGGINIEKLLDITVGGSLDKSVLPDIQKIAERVISELNKTMQNRGYNRRTDLYGQ